MNDFVMFDFKSFYNRMANELPNNCKVCEIGLGKGDSIVYLAKKLHELGKSFKVYGVDNMQYGNFIQMKEIYTTIIESGLAEYIEIIPKDSIEASKDFNDGYLDFIYVDSSHTYEQTKLEIVAWYPKCKDEGILAGHDYNAPEVKQAVDETIPTYFVRTDIADRTFDPEKVLHTENTNNGWGLWWCRKQWYLKLKNKI